MDALVTAPWQTYAAAILIAAGTPLLVAGLAIEIDGIMRPHIGLFEECLTGDKPTAAGMYGAKLLAGRAEGSPILFQALGSWRDHSFGNWTPGDDTPPLRRQNLHHIMPPGLKRPIAFQVAPASLAGIGGATLVPAQVAG